MVDWGEGRVGGAKPVRGRVARKGDPAMATVAVGTQYE